MSFLVENWYIIIAAVAVGAVGASLVIRFVQKPSSEQITKVKEWLLWAVTVAEKELGGGTGQLKLRKVYGMFIDKFPWLVKVISFEEFSKYVDDALDKMKEMLQNNTAVIEYVEKE